MTAFPARLPLPRLGPPSRPPSRPPPPSASDAALPLSAAAACLPLGPWGYSLEKMVCLYSSHFSGIGSKPYHLPLPGSGCTECGALLATHYPEPEAHVRQHLTSHSAPCTEPSRITAGCRSHPTSNGTSFCPPTGVTFGCTNPSFGGTPHTSNATKGPTGAVALTPRA